MTNLPGNILSFPRRIEPAYRSKYDPFRTSCTKKCIIKKRFISQAHFGKYLSLIIKNSKSHI